MESIRTDVGPSETSKSEIYIGPSLDELLEKWKPKQMDEEELAKLTTVLRRMLQYEPNLRPSTAELLEDDWFRCTDGSSMVYPFWFMYSSLGPSSSLSYYTGPTEAHLQRSAHKQPQKPQRSSTVRHAS